jgi:primosomal protein N'
MLPPGLTGRDLLVTLLDPDAVGEDAAQQKLIDLLKRRGPMRGAQIQVALKKAWQSAVDRLVKAEIVRKTSVLAPPKVRPKVIHTATLAIHPDQIPSVARHLGKHSRRADLLEVIAALPEGRGLVREALQIADVARDALRRLQADGYVSVESDIVSLEIPPEEVDELLINLRGGDKQFHILKVLARESGPIEVSWVYAQTGASLSDLKALEEVGLVLLGEKTAWRDSLADRDFVPSVAPKLTPEQRDVCTVIEERIKQWDWRGVHQPQQRTPPPTPPRTRRGEKDHSQDVEFREWHVPPKLWEKLKPLAREKRHEPTQAENKLWQRLRRKELGHPVRRQHPIDRFIVDFYCPEAKLVIEVDGEIHAYTPDEDALRQEFLEALGNKVIRFTNVQVFQNVENVVQQIQDEISARVRSVPLSVHGEGLGEGFRGTFLLHGVTGSGKTEIYLRAIELTLAQGRQAIFLVPEIALTPQTVRRVAARFPGQVAIVHSGLTPGERYDTWRRAREGLIQVVVGARSALFTPLPDIGLIILDEEHDHSYKQSPPITPPYYDARRVAEEMMRHNDGILILGSATPDVETVYRAQRGDIEYLHLPNRIMGHRTRIFEQSERVGVAARYYASESEDALTIDLPPVQIVDMREELKSGNTGMFGWELMAALAGILERREQAMLYLNRRGQSTYVFCRDCGYIAACPRCDTPLTYHRQGEALRCHHCGFQAATPQVCPVCSSKRIKFFGAGTQQVENELKKLFPNATTLRWDADTADHHEAHEAILQRFINREADILVGTQMIAKGLDFPLVTLVGVVSADLGLALPDFRASERVFQLLMQVAGRAGRGLLGGKVILQTYQPDHYAIACASTHDYQHFYEQEIESRRVLGYPPFRRLARIVFRFPNETKARDEAQRAAAMLTKRIAELRMTGTELIGPAPCFFAKLDKHYRWHLLLRGPDPAAALQALDVPKGWHVDIDPVEVL